MPLIALVPVHPLLAVQDVALVELQVRVVEFPVVMVVGFAEMVSVGAGVGVLCVVADTAVLCAETFPTASYAATL